MFRLCSLLISGLLIVGCATTQPRNDESDNTAGTSDSKAPAGTAQKLVESAGRITSLRHEFSDQELQAMFADAAEQVEQKFSIDLSAVKLSLVNRIMYQQVIRGQLKNSEHLFPGLARRPWQLGNATQAVYDPSSSSVFLHPDLTRRYPLIVGPSRALATEYIHFVLLHELIHAVDDINQRLRLEWPTIRLMTNSAVVREGHAHHWASAMCEEQGCANYIRQARESRRRQNTRFSPPNDTLVLYETGERFVRHLLENDSSGQLLERAFKNPPTDEYQLLFPELYPDQSRDNSNQKILRAIRATEMPWVNNDTVEMVLNTVDKYAMRNATNRQLRPAFRRVAGSIQGDAMVGYFPQSASQSRNVVVRVIETTQGRHAANSYSTMVARHRKQQDVQKLYQVPLPGWVFERNKKTIAVGDAELEIKYFDGHSRDAADADNEASAVPLHVMVMNGGRFIVRIESFSKQPYELSVLGEQLLKRLAT
jgi:hypothetical protein